MNAGAVVTGSETGRSGHRAPSPPAPPTFGYTSAAWAEVAGLLRAGKIHLAPLITHRFPLEAFPDAYRTLR
jgi:threonine dehydrogenase-like Zn-dependent dehydrogenase